MEDITIKSDQLAGQFTINGHVYDWYINSDYRLVVEAEGGTGDLLDEDRVELIPTLVQVGS